MLPFPSGEPAENTPVEGEGAMAPIRRIAREGWEIECLTPRTWLESAHLTRIGPKALGQQAADASLAVGVVHPAAGIGGPLGAAWAGWVVDEGARAGRSRCRG